MLKITFLTLFPDLFPTILQTSILGRAQMKGLVDYQVVNIRDFARDNYKTVDDKPYGGGVGMVLKADILAEALKSAGIGQVILTSASGAPFKQSKAQELASLDHLIIVSGHYEGVDQRFIDKYVDQEISIGDFVLSQGELPSMVIADSVVRLIPGVLGKAESTVNESFSDGLVEHPQYTRPEDFEGAKVPEILLSGDHKKINKWRTDQSLLKTKKVRPDLLK